LSEITLELRLVFEIPESGLTINGLIGGLKESVGRIHGEIVVNLMQALEERLIETMIYNDPGRYQRNGRQSKPRHLKCSLGKIAYRFAQLSGSREWAQRDAVGRSPGDSRLRAIPGRGFGARHRADGSCVVSQSEQRGGADRGTVDEPYDGSQSSSEVGP